MTSRRSFDSFHSLGRGNGKRLLVGIVLTLSCLLVLMGVTVPNLSVPATPKPRPRAVVETAEKGAKEAAKRVAAVEADFACCRSNPVPPEPHRTLFHKTFAAVDFVAALLPASRAPPVVFS